MSFTESELAEALTKALEPKVTPRDEQTAALLQEISEAIINVPYLGSTDSIGIVEQKGHHKQIR